MTTWTDDEVGGTVWSEDEASGTALGASTGSSLVGHVSSGSGAVARTVEGKLRDQWIDLADFLPAGYVTDGSVDYATQIASALSAASGKGLRFPTGGGTYQSSTAQTVPANTALDLRGATLNFTPTGSVECLQLRNNTSVRNGTVKNTGTSPSGAGNFQCPIIVGDYAVGTGYHDIILENLSIENNRSDGNGIMVTGDSYNVATKNITFPDSTTLGRAILVHWGGAADPTAGTYHPRNIRIENIHAGQFTGTGTGKAVLFVSGAFNVYIDGARIKECRRAAVTVFAGDYGFYYAPSEYKDLALTGISVKNVTCNLATFAGCTVDGQSTLAPGTPIYDCDIAFENCSLQGDKGASVSNGFTIANAYNVVIRDCNATKFSSGVSTGAAVRNLRVIGGRYWNNRLNGIVFSNGSTAPTNCLAAFARCYLNGENGSGSNRAGIQFGTATDCLAIGNYLGDQSSELYQFYGIVVGGAAADRSKGGYNHVYSVLTGGSAYLLAGSSTIYDATEIFDNTNTVAAGVTRMNPTTWNMRNGRTGYTVTMFDDFLGDVLADQWGSHAGTDPQVVAPAVSFASSTANGMMRMVTGDDAAASMAVNGVQIESALNWRADSGRLVFEARVKLSAITNVSIFVGLTDQVSAVEIPIQSAASADTLTANANDAVGVMFDTAMSTDNWWLVGVAATVQATAQNSALAPVAGTYETWRIEVSTTGVASFYRNNAFIGSAMTAAVTASAPLTPVIAAFSLGAASRNIDADYVMVEANR